MNYWNLIYKKNKHTSIWPWSDLVSKFTILRKKKFKKKVKLLELGCGAGANIRFFLENKVDYYGIDFSNIIIKKLRKKFKNLNKKLIVGDFKNNYFKNKKFDFIVDRAAITHNKYEDINKIVDGIYENLLPNGYFVGIDWYSVKYLGRKKNDVKKSYKFKRGMFADIGTVTFFDKKKIRSIFKKFKILELEEKIVYNRNKDKIKMASWTIVAKKER